jgi:hypothetical protein
MHLLSCISVSKSSQYGEVHSMTITLSHGNKFPVTEQSIQADELTTHTEYTMQTLAGSEIEMRVALANQAV